MQTKLLQGDFNAVAENLKPNTFDLIITDPPYARKHEYTFSVLAHHAANLLKEHGSLVSIIPHYNLPRIVEIMAHTGLRWRWAYIQDQEDGPHPRMAMGVEVCYKLFGHWVKGTYPAGRGFLRDKVPSNPPNKQFHEWQQDLAPYLYYIERLCPKDGTVLDPYCGTGTSLVAARMLGRRAVGVDIDPQMILSAKYRLNAVKRSQLKTYYGG